MNHIVALSGGKDSTAMALRLVEVEPRAYQFVVTPTGDELPPMKTHWKKLEKLLGQPLVRVHAKVNLKGLIREHKMLPNWRARFCTPILKIHPYIAWLSTRTPCVSYVGIRADEEDREGAVYDGVENITQRFPLKEWGWSKGDVLDYLDKRGVTIPARTDCARCFFQTLHEWYLLWKKYPHIYQDAVDDETERGHTFRSPQRDTHPAELSKLREEFERGYVPGIRESHREITCSVCAR